ncbi:MAG: thermonuclease family protein [Verrucomicrobiota bacterium JB023]|nr:thermonuclease family protein [Verrucomicrobiota bacterium JB023]
MKKQKSLGSIILGLLVAALVWFLKERGIITDEQASTWSSGGGQSELSKGEVEVARLSPVREQGAGLELLQDCQLILGRNNDGDSFHVRHGNRESEFRLYFVDTPESQFKTYRGGESNGERLAEQGRYFGGLAQEATTEVGRAAKVFVKRLLEGSSFKVLTKWEDVYGPDRQYGFVIVPWEGSEVYLHELLVAKGLARIHTRGADLPQGRSWRKQKDFLKTLEKESKSRKLGAWGISGSH